MTYQRREYPEWSWSHSRRRMFEECPRLYFYQYYGAHNGWEDESPEHVRLAYRLKQLTNLQIEIGSAVHSAAAFALHGIRFGGERPGFEALLEKVRGHLNRVYKESHDRRAWEIRPNRRMMLHEFYYDTGLSEAAIEESRTRIRSCLTNLLTSQSFREATAAPHVEVRQVDNFVTFDFEGTPVHGVPDLLYRRGDDSWTVTDWKTGREDADWGQMAVYAVFTQERHNVQASKIRARIEWLATGNAEERWLSDNDLVACRQSIIDSIASMRTYIVDLLANAPRDRALFPLKADTSMCRRFCKYYELDGREIAAASLGPF